MNRTEQGRASNRNSNQLSLATTRWLVVIKSSFAKFDEISAMTLQDIFLFAKCYEGPTDTHMDIETVYP